ncbi:S23A2-like protein [Mya arenaria]|uniref:S23A2-like protein n=1 Tax=Mya arenaria TaxID=6604 RepID=A0ABY7F6B2_MYAAR|nr:solute carrier family 23 member 2-like [Mya arenaria]WAR17440.1 S23A2-like protein [Mya arenaria]
MDVTTNASDGCSGMKILCRQMNKTEEDSEKDQDETIQETVVTVEENIAKKSLLYSIADTPPFNVCLLLGFQHYITAVSSIISVPLMLREPFCMDDDVVGVSELIGTILFVSGLSTLFQTTLGVRLPIVQGSTITFVVPTLAILAQKQWTCPYTEARAMYGHSVNFTDIGLPEIGSEEHRNIWKMRIREIQGAIIVASLFQVTIGLSGVMSYLLRFVGPLTIVPVITLTSISLFPVSADMASGQWWIAILTMVLITAFSQIISELKVPVICPGRKGCNKSSIQLFGLYPVLFGIFISTIVCAILTTTGVWTDDKDEWGYEARTDTNLHVLGKAKWFRFPYPCQWGVPTVSVIGVFGMLSGVLSAMIESVGDYFALARLAGAPPPPLHAVNRGVMTEGLCCLITGAWGSGNGTTSFAENIGVVGLTKVGSRRVVQVGGLMMLVLGCLGKFAALFLIIPKPVLGGTFMITFGMVTAVGISNLQFVNLNSPRNLFVLGVPIFFGISLSQWLEHNGGINTGSETVDQLLTVLLSTGMFVGGVLGFVLDNLVPGTDEERGIKSWRVQTDGKGSELVTADESVYDLPVIGAMMRKFPVFRYLPISPTYKKT